MPNAFGINVAVAVGWRGQIFPSLTTRTGSAVGFSDGVRRSRNRASSRRSSHHFGVWLIDLVDPARRPDGEVPREETGDGRMLRRARPSNETPFGSRNP